MSLQSFLTDVALPPLLLAILAVLGGILALRHRRAGAAMASLGALGVLALATPLAVALLRGPLEAAGEAGPLPLRMPTAIIVLGGDAARGRDGLEVGPLTLERLRAGAALHRRTALPILLTAGPLAAGEPALALIMQRSLEEDFGVSARWVETRASDTRGNAQFSSAMLRADGVEVAYLVTHGWHMPRSRGSFARADFPVVPEPVNLESPYRISLRSWIPRPDYLGESWYMIREWVGRAVYALRDG